MWILTTLLLVIPQAYAIEVPVMLLSEETSIEEIVSRSASHAHADISGDGSSIDLTYSTAKPLSVFVIFQHNDSEFSTFETLQATLPAGNTQVASIDLTQSPGWSLGKNAYRLYFFSDSAAGAEFHDIEFIDASMGKLASAMFQHLTMLQPYSPASYHRLAGYIILGVSLTAIVGLALLAVVLVLMMQKRSHMILPVIVVVVLIAHARFSIDALRYSWKHTTEWTSNKTYATAGSIPEIAKSLLEEEATSVYLCHTGTTYAKKLLQYHAYPALITDQNPTHVVVHKSTDWSIDENSLRCGEENFDVTLIEKYNDGSALYLRNS